MFILNIISRIVSGWKNYSNRCPNKIKADFYIFTIYLQLNLARHISFYRWPQSNDNWPPPRLIDCRAMTTSPYDSTYKPFVFSPSKRIFGFLSSGLRSVNHVVIDDQILEHFIWNIGARISPLVIGKWHLAYPFDVSVPQKLFPYKQIMICGPVNNNNETINTLWMFYSEGPRSTLYTYSRMDLLTYT